VSAPIGLIAQGVFPEATLPDAALSFLVRFSDRRSILGSWREKAALIFLQRLEKSESPGGKTQIVCPRREAAALAHLGNRSMRCP